MTRENGNNTSQFATPKVSGSCEHVVSPKSNFSIYASFIFNITDSSK